jgi:hypothetical protein
MPYAKTSQRAEQRALREEMRGLGMSRRQVAVEFARRYQLRPRAAWRHAHGWSLTEAAKQVNAYAAGTGLDDGGATVAMTAAHLCEHENWPGEGEEPSGRRSTPYFLSLLAAVYGCAAHDLLDVADYRHMPSADRLILDKTTTAGGPGDHGPQGGAHAGRRAATAPGEGPPHTRPATLAASWTAELPVHASPNLAAAAVQAELTPLAVALLSAPGADDDSGPRGLADQVIRIWKLRQTARYRELAVDLPHALVGARSSEAEPEQDWLPARLAALTHLYNAASSLARSFGSFELAGIAADRAVRTASCTGDPLLAGAAAYRLANVLLPAGQFGSARAVAIGAADRLRPVMTATRSHTAMWGALLATAAQAAARAQAPAEAWELLGTSKVAADLLTNEQADLFSIFGLASWLIHAVNIAADLGDGTEAVRRAGRVPAGRLPPFLAERRTFLLLGKARGHALCGDAGAATMALLEAEDAAPEEIHSNPEARSLVSRLLPAEQVRNNLLSELAARMSNVVADVAPTGMPQ